MTHESITTRLEKLVDEHYGPESLSNSYDSAMWGGKALLSLLAELEKGHGPRLKAWKIKYADGAWAAAEERFDTNDINFTIYIPLTELLQARASLEETKRQLEIADGNAADSRQNWEETVDIAHELQDKLTAEKAARLAAEERVRAEIAKELKRVLFAEGLDGAHKYLARLEVQR